MKISQNTNQNKKNFPKYMQEKLAVTVLVITLALFSLVVILYNLVKENNEDYNQVVLSQQSYDSRVIPYRRGDIVDRNGTYLATSEKVYNLIIDPKQIMEDPEKYLEATVSALASTFGFDAGELRAMIEEKKGKAYVRHARQLSYDKKEEFENLKKETNKKNQDSQISQRISGVWFEDEYKRLYPYGTLACNVLGFTSSDGSMGNGGMEQFYNNTLIGVNGREYGYLNDESNLERIIKPANNGNTIVSTIDVNIQKIIEKYIGEWESETGSKVTGVVVMNPNNGEILGMASSKPYDLNDPRNLSGYYLQEEIDAMDESAETEAWNQMWRNMCISDTYEPGSPSKIFTVAAALEEGIINGNEVFQCDGYQEVGGWRIRCVKRSGHGSLTVAESLMVSCNDVMMQIAARMGGERFYKYQDIFGFGAKTGIDLPGEADTQNLVHTAEDMVPSDMATNSFGQNYNCNMVQMAAAYCSVINGGAYYEPHVAKQVLNEQGAVIKKIEPVLVRETVSDTTSNFIKDALFRTVDEGTGRGAAVAGYEVGGKTGTAEKYPRGQRKYVVSFAGFAPVENPEVLTYVIIDEPNVEDQAHSSFASSIFQKIMSEILPYMNVFPATELPEEGGAEGQLPSEEGITGGTEGNIPAESEAETQESKVYDSEEYVEPDIESEGGEIPGETQVQESSNES